jgi:hypothetical protein
MNLLANFPIEYFIGSTVSICKTKQNKYETFVVGMSYEDDLDLVEHE